MNLEILPLFFYPSTWIYIDDDKNLLKSIYYFLREFNVIKIFENPEKFMNFISSYSQPTSTCSFLKSIINDERHGILRHTPIDFDVTSIVKLTNNLKRHEEITAMIIDYHMPQMDGLSLAKKCAHFPIKKILLTGKDKEAQAIKGFNHNLIQRFVQKFEENMAETLIEHLKSLTLQYFQNLTSPLLTHLEAENKIPLTDPIFIAFFNDYCKKNNIAEYYLIDKQGSFLLIDKDNKKSCLAVQSEKSIDLWLSNYASDVTENDLTHLIVRNKIPFFGIGIEPWEVDADTWFEHFYSANTLQGREKYYWSTIN